MNVKKTLYVLVGCISFGLGCIGAVLRLLLTVPFLLITLYCFSRSSERLNSWFTSSKIYRHYLEGYLNKRGMTVKTKVTAAISFTTFIAIGLYLMHETLLGQAVLLVVWVCHMLYLIFFLKTRTSTECLDIDIPDTDENCT